MINISKILKDAPQGMKLYSPLFGEVEFCAVDTADSTIVVRTEHGDKEWFSMTGKYKINKSHFLYSDSECLLFPSKECRDWETWLLPTKPMFKVGDWVVDQSFAGPEGYIGEVGIIEGVTMLGDAKKENYYAIRGTDGKLLGGTDCLVREYYLRPWAIEDAKDGDVLATTTFGMPFIYRKTTYVKDLAYCYVGFADYMGITHGNDIAFARVPNVVPATKEQRDTLFAKMKEAGYRWDAEKKELHKIKHYDISSFHAGMPVLVRANNNCKWDYSVFSRITGNVDWNFAVCNGVSVAQCIPFEGNEHLLGTTNMCDEQYINW